MSASTNSPEKRLWVSISWFGIWGLFQAYAVTAVLTGTWSRPEAFPESAYNALVYPDMFFIPLYLVTAVLLFKRHNLGKVFGLFSGGAVFYVMIYLFALSNLSGTINLVFDAVFILINLAATIEISRSIQVLTSKPN